MNYRHGFHAGNHADVLKHVALVFCLEALRRKPPPFTIIDTHGGRGLYDLESAEAARSPEWQAGVGRLMEVPAPPPAVARYLDAVAAINPGGAFKLYPGSPLLIGRALRPGDEAHICELHEEEFAILKRSVGALAGLRLHQRDGWEALRALAPPSRGLVLIDPPYERTDELTVSIAAIKDALKRFGHGCYLWWRPLKDARVIDAADAEIRAAARGDTLRADLWVDAPRAEGKLAGSSLLLINPPFGLSAALREALPFLAAQLSAGDSGWRLQD